jgi:hypothetical protein
LDLWERLSCGRFDGRLHERRSEQLRELSNQQLEPTPPAMVAVDPFASFLAVIVLEGRDCIPDCVPARHFPWTADRHVDTLRPYGRRVERFGRGERDSILPLQHVLLATLATEASASYNTGLEYPDVISECAVILPQFPAASRLL